ncbi:MAG: transglutaminase domain-containing protein [Bacilli bacterium]|nr:transglutaminase domain-containing protein [Bacilli bacterium]
MKLENIKTPEDILEFMKSNIKYGWLDINNEEHIGNMKGFRSLYRTSSLEETLNHKIGTCIEQVYLMKSLLDKINIPNKMFCTRIYEGEDFNDLEADEHMHCFVLYYLNNKVYQIEHPNWERVGIYEYTTEEEAIDKINEYYIEMAGGHARPVTEFFEVEQNLSFKQFNNYINSLDKNNIKNK